MRPLPGGGIVEGMTTLSRSRDNRVIAGVCAGLADRFGTTATTMRVIFLVSCLLPGPQFLVYLALWIMIPNSDDRPKDAPKDWAHA